MKRALTLLASAALLTMASRASAQEWGVTGRVHLDGDTRDVVVEARDEFGWSVVCRGPCDRPLPADTRLRISGDGIQRSSSFVLSPHEDVQLGVTRGNPGLHTFGAVLVTAGSVAMGAGLQMLLYAWVTESCSDCVGGFADTTLPNVAWTVLGAGVLALVVGAIMLPNTRAQVINPHETLIAPSAMRRDTERRTLPQPAIFGFPILHITF